MVWVQTRFQLHLAMSVFKLECGTYLHVWNSCYKSSVQIYDELNQGFLMLYISWVEFPLHHSDNLSLGGLSSPLRIKKRTWWLEEKKIFSLNFGVLEIVQPSAFHMRWNQECLKPSFPLIMIKRLCMYEILHEIKLDLTIGISASSLSDHGIYRNF